MIGFTLGMFVILALREHIPALRKIQEIKYAYVNIDTIIQDISSHIAQKEYSTDEVKKKIEEYRMLFLKRAQGYSELYGVVVISEPKVIAGIPDITEKFLLKQNE